MLDLVATCEISLVVVLSSCGARTSHCGGFSCFRAPALKHGLRMVLSCHKAYGILPEQGSNSCPLHWQAASEQLDHQGNQVADFLWLVGGGDTYCNQLTLYLLCFALSLASLS